MLTFKQDTHEYFWNGVRVPGVTEILTSLGLIDPRFFDERSRIRGTYVHKAIALLLRDDLDWSTVDPRIEGYVRAGEKAIIELKIKPKVVETPFYHDQWRVAGCPDLLEVDDILDEWKTGVMLPAYKLQVGLYEILLEHNGHPVKKGRIIQLNEDATYGIHPVDIRVKRDAVAVLSYNNVKMSYGG